MHGRSIGTIRVGQDRERNYLLDYEIDGMQEPDDSAHVSTFYVLIKPSLPLSLRSVLPIRETNSPKFLRQLASRKIKTGFLHGCLFYTKKKEERRIGENRRYITFPSRNFIASYRIPAKPKRAFDEITNARLSLSLEILELLVDDVTSIIGASLLPLENFTGGNRFKSNDEKHNLLSEQPTSHRPRKVEECEISSKCSWCARSAIERERVAHVRYRTIPPLTSFRSISCRRIPSRCEQRKL